MQNKIFIKLLKQLNKLTLTQSKKAEEYLHNKRAIRSEDALLCSDKKPVHKAFANIYHFTLKMINLCKNEHTNESSMYKMSMLMTV